jgi:hypothetical protein
MTALAPFSDAEMAAQRAAFPAPTMRTSMLSASMSSIPSIERYFLLVRVP